MPPPLYYVVTILYMSALGLIVWSDLATRLVPDRAVVAVAVLGLAARLAAGPIAASESVAISAGLFFVLACLHVRGFLGGGDVKLIAAATLGLPPAGAVHLITATALAGGVLAGLHLLLRLLPHPAYCRPGASALVRVCTIERWRIRRHGSLPYAVAIAAGTAWALLLNFGS